MFPIFRLRQAMQFGNKLIFDCSYEQHMSTFERRATAKQLLIGFSNNRKHKDPFDLHFCNVDFNGDTMKQLERYIPTMRNTSFPLHLHEGSLLDVFPKKEELVYLTPHCKEILTKYDPDSTYIIGAMVDKSGRPSLSLAKCKELGIRMAKLPLERYLEWGAGSNKSLTLDQMTKIMLDLKDGKSWEVALRHVPKRKIVYEEANEKTSARKFTVNSFKTRTATDNVNSKFERNDQNKFKSNLKAIMDNKSEHNVNTAVSEKFHKFNQNIRTKKDEFGNDLIEDKTTSTASKFLKNVKPRKK